MLAPTAKQRETSTTKR